MRIEHEFVCTLANGLHARPASLIAEQAARFAARILLVRRVTPEPPPADARSVLSVIGLDVRQGDRCTIRAEGDDARPAIEALREVIELRLDEAEQAAEIESARLARASTRVPMVVRALGARTIAGEALCSGFGFGEVVLAAGLPHPASVASAPAGAPESEHTRARHAIESVRDDLLARSRTAAAPPESALLAAHSQMVQDPTLWESISAALAHGADAPQAVVQAAATLGDKLRSSSNAYIRERALDVQDIAMQILERLLPRGFSSVPELVRDSIVFADALTPNQLLRLNRAFLKGLVLGPVGRTSHTAILARGFAIPCIINVARPSTIASPGHLAVVDAEGGFVIAPAQPDVQAYYARLQNAAERRAARLGASGNGAACTRDGQRLEIAVNASTAAEVEAGVARGADGVGLFRTEFLFLERDHAPDEDEQFTAYSEAIRAAAGRPIIFRTFDIGGDKPAPYLRMAHEENPFLGCRGVRLHMRHPAMLDVQLRALLRAAAGAPAGSVRIMAPMVSTPDEASWFRSRVAEASRQVREAGRPAPGQVPVGVMIEVPAAVHGLDLFAPYVDFFSIGTNDLCQYWMAADRGNPSVATLNNPHHPTFLRALRYVATQARRTGKWLGVCGEMGGRPQDLPLMIALGVDEISASGSQVLVLKQLVRTADSQRCRDLLDRACAGSGPGAVEELLAGGSWRAEPAPQPVIDPACIDAASGATSKEDAIARAIELLWIAGRTDRPRDVEAAVWVREQTYSTGLGHGFAIPHCKCDAVDAASLVVLKLQGEVDWGSMDGQPVRTVLLLAAPGSGTGSQQHMKIFATLARRLMHEEFRLALASLTESSQIEAVLRSELQLN
jgi:fructose-specific PTS system IIA-like component